MKRLLLLVLLGCWFGSLLAQQQLSPFVFDAPYYDDGVASFEGPDKQTLLFGNTSSYHFSSGKPWMIIIDSNDQLVDRITFNNFGLSNEHIESVIRTTYGMFIMTGYVQINGQYRILVAAVTPSGQKLWAKHYGGDDWIFAKDIVQISGNDFVVCGETYSNTAGGSDGFLFRINAQGDSLRYASFGGSLNDAANTLFFNKDNELVVTGFSKSYGLGSKDVFLYRCTQNLDSIHFSVTSTKYDHEAFAIIEAHDHKGYVLGGMRMDSLSDQLEWSEKVDSLGNYLWNHKAKTGKKGCFYDLVYSPWDLSYHFLGLTNQYGFGGNEVQLHKINKDGFFIDSRTLGGSEDDEGCHIRFDDNKTFHITGLTRSFGVSLSGMYYIRLDSVYNINLSNIVYMQVGLKEATQEFEGVELYPNPASDNIQLRFQASSQQEYHAQIVDMTGRVVSRWSGISTGIIQFSVHDLPEGMYLLTLTGKSGVSKKKFVVKR